MKLRYPIEFAEGIWIPFERGSFIRSMIERSESTIDDWLEHGDHWLAIEYMGKRHRYTEQEMRTLWNMITCQKKRVMAWFLVHAGHTSSFDQAMALVNKKESTQQDLFNQCATTT